MPTFLPRKRENLTKADYFRALAKEFIENNEWVSEKNDIDENAKKHIIKRHRRVDQHELLHLPKGCGKRSGSKFRKIS